MSHFLYTIISAISRALSAWADRLQPKEPADVPIVSDPASDIVEQEPQPKLLRKLLRIENHRLKGVDFVHSPNQGGPITPEYIIIHYTANNTLSGTVRYFQSNSAKVSAHLVIDRDGTIVQMVNFNRAAWHAGISAWGHRKGMNDYSIGIELVNWGKLDEGADGNLYSWTSDLIEKEQAEKAGGFWWHKYTPEQIEACREVVRELCGYYPIYEVLGHSDISPGRKVDPGPLFPIDKMRNL